VEVVVSVFVLVVPVGASVGNETEGCLDGLVVGRDCVGVAEGGIVGNVEVGYDVGSGVGDTVDVGAGVG